MSRCWAYLFLGILLLLIQSTVLPLFLAIEWRPNLLLILVTVLVLNEPPWPTLPTLLLLGAGCDSLSGTTVGLHVAVYLLLFILARSPAEKLNTESLPMLILMVVCGTVVYTFLIGFLLVTIADVGHVVVPLLTSLPQQLISNLVAAIVLLTLMSRLLPGLWGRSCSGRGRGHGDPI